ncbi:27 kDa outer membrane protein, putative [Oceanicola granulosus HTCC2516]|uniref:27 kDa outer membrane protein, putative n=1 Tax=Oceanicola granulosus (strain ATCC BAA-861 / DSM 15982 / KCTC 12143 / HTCC2516) TaxID=314256 RepID=Q2C9P3_OCEGH|nr:DsbA family protein [Oceanicola granulosus]EAR49395.1 27 kDa outer membrane protein, putative [Oceanicola granulosus HTCC2516]
MMRSLTAAALAAGLAAPAAAFDLEALSDSERDAFRAEVRAYLLEHPEVLMEAIGVLEQRDQAAQAASDVDLARANLEELQNDGYSFVGGNPDGDVTLVEFVDYRCGYCRRAHAEVEELLASDGNIRFVVKEFPILGEGSTLSSQFAIAVKQLHGDAAYKNVHDALITLRSDADEPSLRRLAEGFGLEADEIFARMGSDEVADEINETRALAQRLQITGTPTFVLEDQMLRGYLPLEQMQAFVDAVRAEG